jgi:hypothetical protein
MALTATQLVSVGGKLVPRRLKKAAELGLLKFTKKA